MCVCVMRVGGRQDLASVEVYDASADTWQPVPDMRKRRSGLCLAVLNRQLHALGGYDGQRVPCSPCLPALSLLPPPVLL